MRVEKQYYQNAKHEKCLIAQSNIEGLTITFQQHTLKNWYTKNDLHQIKNTNFGSLF